ncbi:MAG: component of SufBCD complex [Pseudomonadota bacterium]
MDLAILERAREVIDLRSFSNLWYWIVLAVLWSTVSHWVLGVPFDLVVRARRGQEQASRDLRILAEVNVNRILSLVELSGPAVTAGAAFLLTGLGVLGWVYGNEFSQAVFLLAAPMVLIGLWSTRTARNLRKTDFADLPNALRWHRVGVQAMGVVFIFITAFWGMYVNVTVSPLAP